MASLKHDHNHARPEPMRQRLLNARLITLMTLAGESATLAYRRRLHMPEPVRQVLLIIGGYGSVTSKDIVVLSGREKAQISRSVNALSSSGLVDRRNRRSPMTLSDAGKRIFDEIMDIAIERNEVLCQGIPAREIEHFLERTRDLIDRAAALYDSEGRPPAGKKASPRTSLHHPPSHILDSAREAPAQPILPWLQSLTTYIQRSGSVVFKREIGLSNFEWRILSQIGEYQPTTLSFIISMVSRDKSQVARTVKDLHSAGLIEREDEGRMNVSLTLTAEGAARYDRMCEISIERDEFLFRGWEGEERLRYIAVIDRLTDNARKMLVAEEAVEHIEHAAAQPASPARTEKREEARRSSAGGADMATLVQENARLKLLLAEAMLENARLKERLSETE